MGGGAAQCRSGGHSSDGRRGCGADTAGQGVTAVMGGGAAVQVRGSQQ